MNKHADCIFCSITKERIISENEYAYVIYDEFPVTKFHSLVITKRHVKDYFSLNSEEFSACNNLLNIIKENIHQIDGDVEGFNIGINNGEVAGQSIFHCHIHLIPRRKGDIKNPRGGVRHIIPGKGNY